MAQQQTFIRASKGLFPKFQTGNTFKVVEHFENITLERPTGELVLHQLGCLPLDAQNVERAKLNNQLPMFSALEQFPKGTVLTLDITKDGQYTLTKSATGSVVYDLDTAEAVKPAEKAK